MRGIDTVEQLAEVKRVVIEVARGTAILNADDPLCLKMADYSNADKLCYVTMNRAHPLVREHIQAGGLAVVLEQGINGHMITLYDDNGHHIPLLWTHLIPATLEGRALHNVQNAMFAAALAHNLGVDLDNIRHGLRTFDTTFFQAPGRLNVYDELPFKVIMDYAHNPAAVKTICDVVDRFEVPGRKIVVLAMPGDRRDEDIREVAGSRPATSTTTFAAETTTAADADPDRGAGDTGRRPGSKPASRNTASRSCPMSRRPTSPRCRWLAAGDLLLILADSIARSWKQIIYFKPGDEVVADQAGPAAVEIPPDVIGSFELDDNLELIRDERGVRIARESED